ncbi:uncharacterized protein LOC130191667 [Pseudoliparis swirei]|uniref:uncharacterized protein LOC130191667 n=1 Tax=Pseudoliparis swirei TaxID=2059687 RepID=UPI0024BE6B06|nr:uncharacterized protein LOC130191667 [Pseudoliparis swirei]
MEYIQDKPTNVARIYGQKIHGKGGKKEKFVNRAGKRQRDTLSKAETLTAGQLQKAAELKEDQSILLHIKDKDCVALEVQYHKGCYNQYTRFLTRPEKPEKDQNEPTFDVIYKIFCERVIRQRLLVNQEVLRMGQLRKAFIELDMLKKRLARDFPQLVFHIPTKRNICELVFAETLSTIDITKVSSALGTSVCSALIGIHTFSGCDSTSAFYGKGKKKTFSVACEKGEYLKAFKSLGTHGGSVVSTVASQQEGPGFESRSFQVLSVWSLHVLLVSAWVYSGQ